MTQKQTEISSELRDLVYQSVKLLGDSIHEMYGPKVYKTVEDLRLQMKKLRSQSPKMVAQELDKVYRKLDLKHTEELHQIAKSFSLMLEVINACEAAYRIYRLNGQRIESSVAPHALVFVFTSHPTEARSRSFLQLMDNVEKILLAGLESDLESSSEKLSYLFRMALMLDLANNRRPQVVNEAEQIFHTVLDERILTEQIEMRRKGIDVFFSHLGWR